MQQNKILKDYNKVRTLYNEGATFTAIDTETTGLSPSLCQIMEIGAVKFNKDGIISTYSQLFNPQQLISTQIEQLTHITNEMVQNKPFIMEELPVFLESISNTILVGHNIRFDLNFINTTCINNNLPVTKNHAVDTLQFSFWAYPDLYSHKQDYLADYFKIEKGSVHRAFDDANTCMKLFLTFLESPKIKP